MARSALGAAMRKVTLRLFEDDVRTLRSFYPEVGYNFVVRALVRRHCRQLEASATARLRQGELTEEQPMETNSI
jgi:hypothetical protein